MNAPEHRLIFQQHPLSAAFPAMPESEIEALAEDIEKGGQRDPGILFEGMVLDGWHRFLACQRLGIQFRSVEFDGEDPVAFVLSKNLHRRHLTASQRAAAVVAATNWKPEGRPKQNSAPGAELSAKQMAKVAEVSPRTIEHAKAAQAAGLGEKVKDGEVSAKRAAEVAKLPPKEREKALKEPAPTEKKGRSEDAGKQAVRIAELESELAEMKDVLAEMRDLAASAKAFEDKAEFKEMQVLRVELRGARRRRDELMRENAELKKEAARWRKKAEKK